MDPKRPLQGLVRPDHFFWARAKRRGGIPMATLYLLTRRLWASIGYHVAWNFTEAYVFGAQVSGTGSGSSLYQVRPLAGIDPLGSGGAFGPEASVASVVACELYLDRRSL
jgi:membrane protease YdiL (CAAX protease family)